MRKLHSWILSGSLLFASQSAFSAANLAVVELQTNLGTVAIQLDYAHAPISSANFINYVNNGFYKNTLIHRITTMANDGIGVIQGGGIDKTSGLQKSTPFTPIINEASNGLSNVAGTISMARLPDPNSATSQFFINVVNNIVLDKSAASAGYAVFGKVIKGMPIVSKIGNLKSYSQLPFSDSGLIYIDNAYASTGLGGGIANTRLMVTGVGRVTSNPIGISCGNGSAACVKTQTAGGNIQLTATPAVGYVFSNWRGDCQGNKAVINLNTSLGNHNCTAVFIKAAPAVQ